MENIMEEEYFKDGEKEGFFSVYSTHNNKEILKYEGFFKKGLKYGKGILYYENGNKKYEGYFIDGNYEGIGIEFFIDGKRKRKMKYYKGEPLKECFGVLYDNNNNEVYKGLLKNEIPENGVDLTIYDNEDNKIYKGDFSNFKYNGKGILFYEKNNHIYYEGYFKMDFYDNGILYDPKGNKIYEGKFINNLPLEGKK